MPRWPASQVYTYVPNVCQGFAFIIHVHVGVHCMYVISVGSSGEQYSSHCKELARLRAL